MKIHIFLLLLLVLASCKKDAVNSPSNDNENSSYPTVSYKLSQPELDSLQAKFNKKILGTKYLAKLDSFGLLGHFGLLSRGKSNISEPAQAISLAKAALLRLDEFSNILDTSALSIKEATNYNPTPMSFTDWRIIFNNQSYNGMEVWNTQIMAIVTDDFILLDGHYYKNIVIPKESQLSKEQAVSGLIGKTINYYCKLPSVFVISDSTINLGSLTQCIYPLVKSSSIELHVVWKIPISFTLNDSPMWFYFVDIITGEVIAIKQLFVC